MDGSKLLNIIFNRTIISSPNNTVIDNFLPFGGEIKAYIQYAVHINRANAIISKKTCSKKTHYKPKIEKSKFG